MTFVIFQIAPAQMRGLFHATGQSFDLATGAPPTGTLFEHERFIDSELIIDGRGRYQCFRPYS
jgi:hypothetical protein